MAKNYNYIKIETPFKRNEDGSKTLTNIFRNEAIEYLKDNQFEWTEKIDGMCTVVKWNGVNVTFEGHTDKAQLPSGLVTYLNEHFNTNEAEELFEQNWSETPIEIYGEGYGNGIQRGGAYRSDKSFIIFDVFIPSQNLWLKRDAVNEIAKMFGCDSVPVVMTGTLQDAIDFVKTKPKSTIGTANMEGVVGRPLVELFDRRGNRIIVKVKCCDFN